MNVEIKENTKKSIDTVKIASNGYRWNLGVYTSNFVRQFPSNTILFINIGTSDLKINDIGTLRVGESRSFEGNQNEVDFTMWKFTFAAGGALEVWFKEDYGQNIISEYNRKGFIDQSKIPNKREQDKKRARYERDKGDF